MRQSSLLHKRLDAPVRRLRQRVEGRWELVAELASRCLPLPWHRRLTDPVQEAILQQTGIRLQDIHEAAQQYLPIGIKTPTDQDPLEERTGLSARRSNHHGQR